MEEVDVGDALFLREALGLFDEFGGEIKGGDVAIALMPETDGHATRAATGFE